MSKYWLMPITAAVAVAFSAPTKAADVTVSGDVLSSYVWRGVEVNGDAVLQPAVDVAGMELFGLPLGINVWGNMDLGDNDGALDSGEFSEVDLTLTLELPLGLNLGYIEYWFPGGADSAREVSLSYGLDVVLQPELTVYFDVSDDPEEGESADYYANLGVTVWGGEVAEGTTASVGAAIGYSGEDHAVLYGGGTDSGFFDWSVTVSATKQISDAATLGLTVTYTDNVDDDALSDAAADTDVFGGITGAVAF